MAALVVAAILAFGAADAEAACTVSASGVAFGTYDVYQTSPTDSTGTITFRCGNQDKDILITISRGSSSTFNPRTMQAGGDVLVYNLYRDAAMTQIWGDGSGGTSAYFNRNPQPNNQDIPLTVFGRIPAGQDAAPGLYSDTVVVSIEY